MFPNLLKIIKCFFEFYPSYCVVKDLATGRELLQGTLEKGLYRVPLTTSQPSKSNSTSSAHIQLFSFPSKYPESIKQKQLQSNATAESSCRFKSALVSRLESNVSSYELWHRRLGHPGARIVNSVLKNCNVKASINEK